ncbi:hypothetical protein SADUNF_Sadunf16G0024800 [Salix dunnii]|uniref:Uncharacterized protein n=1 Tax=Salix dunnii TaxID=1413687 RepID=A0A835J811_9ROSI|nr:hypothetical protein SADUNF_Sadunf16G0024800 [Salix dunnii]
MERNIVLFSLKGTFLSRWNPDAIVFNSSKHCGTLSYWVQKLFRESNGATLLDAELQTNSSTLVASAITWRNSDGETCLKIKVVSTQFMVENSDMDVVLSPYSETSFDLLTESNSTRMRQTDSFSRSSI